jgi:hypothetical protein
LFLALAIGSTSPADFLFIPKSIGGSTLTHHLR